MLAGVLIVAGCAAPHSSGVVPLHPGSYALTVTSRSLGTAAEMALSEATGFCTRQGEQTQLLRTQINPGDYQVVFRCVGAVSMAGLAGQAGGPGPGVAFRGPVPGTAPILQSQAFAVQPPLPADLPMGYAIGLGPSGLPAQPPTLAALMAAALPPPLQSPLAGQPAARSSEPVFAPLPAAALAPVPAPRSFESLPPVTGMPGGPPQRALTPLPVIGEPPRRAFVMGVPAGLPPPVSGPVGAEVAGRGGASVTPPAGFWNLRRN